MVQVVVGNVGVIDGGCGAVARGDVAALGQVLGGLTEVWVAVSVVWGVAWVLKSTPAFFNVMSSSFSGGSVCRAAQRRSGAESVCTAVSMVIVGKGGLVTIAAGSSYLI